MRQTRAVEFGTGLFILFGIGALFFLATQTTNIETYGADKGYVVTARFTNVGGLKVRAPVTMAGVTIGRVSTIAFDPKRLDAVVTMKIESRYNTLPSDSSASVLTSGLLGEQYIGLEPGGAETNLKDGDQIQFTQPAIVLENLIGKFLFNNKSSEKQ